MTAEEEAIVKDVTAKLLGEFYVGQRVRRKQNGKVGTIISVHTRDLVNAELFARVEFDDRDELPLWYWALEPA